MAIPTTLTINDDMSKSIRKTNMFPQLFAAFAATISAFGTGSVEAFTSPGIPNMVKEEDFGVLETQQQSMIASLALFGAVVSGPPVGFMIGMIGRRSCLMILSIQSVIGWILIASATNMEMLYMGRILTGFCAGAASLIVPIYVGEIAEDKIRGLLCSCFQVMVTLGNLTVYVLGTYVTWQWLAFVCGLIQLFGLALMVFVPSSPTYLLSKNRTIDAVGSLMSLRGTKSYQDIEHEFDMIQRNLKACNAEGQSIRDYFKPQTLKPLVICIFLFVFQQATGIEAVLVYTVFVFDTAGTKMNSNHCTIIVGVLQFCATVACACLVDKAGRRILLMISQLGVGVTMLSLAAYLYVIIGDPTIADRFNWIPLTCLGLFIMSFSIGAGPVPFLMLAELNSAAAIGVASALLTTLNWSFASLITVFFMDIEIQIGLHWCFAGFAACSFLGIGFVFVFVPETKGKSIEEIQSKFRSSTSRKQKQITQF